MKIEALERRDVPATPGFPPSEIWGFVYHDANDNCVKDANEAGIAGVTVTLSGSDVFGNKVATTSITGADGKYQFSDLDPGVYLITETQPAGWEDGCEQLGTGVDAKINGNDQFRVILDDCDLTGRNFNFGEKKQPPPPPPELNSISGFVYCDANDNGIMDAGEDGIAGVVVSISSAAGGVAAVTTDATGRYFFGNLAAGTYTISESQPDGFEDGFESAGTPFAAVVGDDRFDVTIPASAGGVAGVNYNFGELGPSSISGRVYLDNNINGRLDAGDTGLAGVTLFLSGVNVFGETVSLSTTSDASGNYSFTHLEKGVYRIIQVQPNDLINGAVTPGTSGGVAHENSIENIHLDACTNATGYFFGEVKCDCPEEPKHSISGFVYEDCDFDGVRDGNEVGIAGVRVVLSGVDSTGAAVNLTTTTGADGSYRFTNLNPGNYRIDETQPAAFLDGKEQVGTPFGGVATGVGGDSITNIVIPSSTTSQAGVEYNFGEVNNSISGFVYEDDDDDGVKDAGEAGIGGVRVTLTGVNDLNEDVSLETTTAADGSYTFARLRPGRYRVNETQPAGYDDGKDTVGDAGGQLSANDEISNIDLFGCTHGKGYNFGERVKQARHSISGFVYEDCDFDGVRDGNEVGIAGVRVVLSGVDSTGAAVNLTTTTGADGSYRFTNLNPGNYRIDETQPAAFLDGKEQVGTPFGGVATGVGGDSITNIVIPSSTTSQAGVEYNFGEVNNSISGFVYEDNNDDGVKNAGEAGIAGVTVTLTGVNDLNESVSLTATTAADGSYSFTRLRPGQYRINETQPAGYDDGKDTVGDAGGQLSANDEISNIDLFGCTHGKGYNFGERVKPVLHSISGSVFNDCPNNDGVRDPGETGIAGVTIILTGVDDLGASVSLTTTTDANGDYKFSNLRAGTYRVAEMQPNGFIDGKDKAGTPFAADATVNDVFSNIVIPPSPTSQNGVNYNFGELLPSRISGFVFLERDGTPNYTNRGAANGDVPLVGVTITLTGTNDQGVSVSATTTTNTTGFYEFADLRPGTYTLRETQPADPGIKDDLDFAGTIKGATVGTVGNDIISNIVIPPCESGQEYNFGEKLPGVAADVPNSISGFVYHDLNRNGIKDPNEPGIPCVTIILSGTSTADPPNAGPVSRTVQTSATGFYQFLNVFAGTYTLTEIQPIAYQDFRESIGTPFAAQLPPADNDTIINIQVPALPGGLNGVNYNFGEVREISKRDFIVFPPPADCGDGIDRGVAGIIVTPQINDFIPITTAVIAIGANVGAAPVVRVQDADTGQDLVPPFFAYNADFRGGVRVAVADITGDGYKDIITSPGPGGEPTVAVYSGLSGALVTSFLAYDAGFQSGVRIAVGDVNGDGRPDIITSPDVGGGPHVRVFDGKTFAEIRGFMAYATSYTGGVTVAAGDVDGDGKAEIITGPISGSTADNKVRVISLAGAAPALVSSFSVPDATTAGVNLAVGDLDNDGKAEILAAPTTNVSAKVRVYRGTDGVEIGSFNAFDAAFASGLRLAAADFDGDGDDDVFVSAVDNNTAQIRILSGLSGVLVRELTTAVVGGSANVFLAGGSAFGVA